MAFNRKVYDKLMELHGEYPFISSEVIDFVLDVGMYPPWPGEGEEELTAELESEYNDRLLEHVRAVYLTQDKWFFEIADTKRKLAQLEDSSSPVRGDLAKYERKDFVPDLDLTRRVSPPGKGERPRRSTLPPEGKVRQTITIPTGLHALLKKRALDGQTTVTKVMLELFEKNISECSYKHTDTLEWLEEKYSVQASSIRLSVNVPSDTHFKLKRLASNVVRPMPLNRLIIRMLIIELYNLEQKAPIS